ncbi:hypothetical protein LS684_07355 [Cytobacillus spongiae]|uniref:hypothetical protein n=1 Tax=Cytobacillus spongiae TaxID=2901381 RepID=UPI001F2348C6|nr:hypothetical protein [Cytobacillus spongiae]UII57248.1 hypothetical protein LS684_07355 [Cytobacillus spongiae]
MRIYTVILLQLILWSGYTFIEWLSKHDHFLYKFLMFFVFLYLAILLGNYITRSKRKTFLITLISLGVYGSFHITMNFIHS